MVDSDLRHRLRLAKAILTEVEPARPASFSLPTHVWDDLQQTCHNLDLIRQRHWPTATQSLVEDLERGIERLIAQLRHSVASARTLLVSPNESSLRDVLADLTALDGEFTDVRWDLRAKTLSAVTDDIVLENVALGPFQIVLDYGQLGLSKPYSVIAMEPNSAAGEEGTTHPHVKNDDLCEGDGQTAIRQALRQGRIFDFFVLVRQILETYNVDSAYVPLSRWEGTYCPDCGTTVSDDDLSYCEQCDSDVCSDCSGSCGGPRCGRSLCSGCSERCGTCGDTFCRRCLTSCPDCEDDYCTACLVNGRCPDCQEEPSDATTLQDPDHTTEPAEPAGIAVHTHGLGQALVPAGSG